MRAATIGARIPIGQPQPLPCRTPHSGTGTAHRPPQPLPWYTPTIGHRNGTQSLSGYRWHVLRLYHVGHPTAGTQSLTDSLSGCYRHRTPSSETDRLSGYRWHVLRLYAMSTPTIGHRNGTQTASQIHTGTAHHRARQTASAGKISPRAPLYSVLYILTDLYKYRSVYTYTCACMRAHIKMHAYIPLFVAHSGCAYPHRHGTQGACFQKWGAWHPKSTCPCLY